MSRKWFNQSITLNRIHFHTWEKKCFFFRVGTIDRFEIFMNYILFITIKTLSPGITRNILGLNFGLRQKVESWLVRIQFFQSRILLWIRIYQEKSSFQKYFIFLYKISFNIWVVKGSWLRPIKDLTYNKIHIKVMIGLWIYMKWNVGITRYLMV